MCPRQLLMIAQSKNFFLAKSEGGATFEHFIQSLDKSPQLLDLEEISPLP